VGCGLRAGLLPVGARMKWELVVVPVWSGKVRRVFLLGSLLKWKLVVVHVWSGRFQWCLCREGVCVGACVEWEIAVVRPAGVTRCCWQNGVGTCGGTRLEWRWRWFPLLGSQGTGAGIEWEIVMDPAGWVQWGIGSCMEWEIGRGGYIYGTC
jgi:hypothetical protein